MTPCPTIKTARATCTLLFGGENYEPKNHGNTPTPKSGTYAFFVFCSSPCRFSSQHGAFLSPKKV
jgi:hypothetical protein